MGSALSKRLPTNPPRPKAPTAPRKPSPSSPVPNPLAPPTRAPYHRPTASEWAATLSKISSSIASSPWEGASAPGSVHPSAEHPSQRSVSAAGKLPRRLADVASHEPSQVTGRLSQNQVLALFALRKRDPVAWDVDKVAAKFRLDQNDVEHLLRFSRTYTGRLDPDGRVRAYYKDDPEDTIVAFERD